MIEKAKIDVHCHFFNLLYLLREILDIWWRCSQSMQIESISNQSISTSNKSIKVFVSMKKTRQIIRWFLELIPAVLGDCETQYKRLDAAFKARNMKPRENLVVAPLMMDIYCFLKEYIQADIEAEAVMLTRDNFKEKIDELEQVAIEEIENFHEQIERVSLVYDIEKIKKAIKILIQQIAKGIIKEIPKDMSWGYATQFKELMDLEKNNNGTVFPFLAVDPRRKGIEDIVKANVGKNGPFYGIKLYTRLGYLPDDERLDVIFDFCEKNDIPIIVHCSDGGFPPGKSWKYKDNADPEKWENVLKKHEKLRVDFAHFGKQEKSTIWRDKIIKLMNDNHKNVYADLAYYPDSDSEDLNSLKNIKKILGEDVKVRQRLMFGTDYVMVALSTETYLKGYFDKFQEILPDYLEALMTENPEKFLNIK